jgi:hypothetical protein
MKAVALGELIGARRARRRDAADKDSHVGINSSGPLVFDKNWRTGFLKRHPDLKTGFGRSLEYARQRATEPVRVNHFFELVAWLVGIFPILLNAALWWNMDETHLNPGNGDVKMS